ncbi:MAG TPA: polysaccharide biosynthesis tyrosine autokinase [Bryobacteraceae bacterium]
MPHPNRLPEPGDGRQYGEIQPIAYGRESDEEFDPPGLIQYWRILRRHRGTWIVFAFAGALLGVLIALPQTPLYRARTSLEILELNDNFLNFKQVSPITPASNSPETADIQTQIKILQSDSLLKRVEAKLKKNMPAPGPTGRVSAWRKVLNLPEPSAGGALDAALQKVAASIAVHVTGQTRIIEVTADSANPQLAARFANTLANEYIEQNLEARWKTTERTSNWLARQLDDMRIKLERSEDALQSYARKSGLLFTDEKTSVSEEKLRQLQQELSAATAERIARQSRYEMAQHSSPDALPDVLNDDGLRNVQSKITDLRRQVAQLSATYTPEYKSLKRAQAELASLEAAFQHDRAAILKRIKNEYDESERKEKLLSSAYQAQTAQVTGEGEKSIQYKILKREADSNRQLYDSMLQQLKESTIASAMRASNVRVVDPAEVPGYPYKPKPVHSAGMGLFVGIFLGAAFIVMRESADRTIQQPGDCPLYLNLPELGIIPSGKYESRKKLQAQPRALAAAAGSSSVALALPGQVSQADKVELMTWRCKPSLVAESFRSTLISILFSGENGESPKVLVVTSAGPEEGKSTVVSNLAIAIAEVGQKVLLIDADMRRPRQHEIFSMDNKRGLSSLLRERTVLNGDRSLGGLIRETEVPGLFVLTSGPETFAATTLIYNSHMPELLGYAREEFDTVLIDTPPMLQISDARVLGRMADKVILVVRAGRTTRDAALAARQRFSEDGAKLLGTILNDWNPRSAADSSYAYYRTDYYLGRKRMSRNAAEG